MSNLKKRSSRKVLLFLFLLILAASTLWLLLQVGGNLWEATSSQLEAPALEQSVLTHVEEEDYETTSIQQDATRMGSLILVNGQYPCPFLQDDTLISVYEEKTGDYKVRSVDVKVQREMMDSLNRLFADYVQKTGSHEVNILSGYRSWEEQEAILAQKVETMGEQEAQRWASAPGKSEHHTGYAMDFGIYTDSGRSKDFTGKGEQSWLTANGCLYGFVQRYPEDKENITAVAEEPWHFRYVGVPHAQWMQQQDLCLEEYLPTLKEYSYGQQHLLLASANGERYEIYYERPQGKENASFRIHVPKDAPYWISGDNMGGIVVTILRSN